MTTKTKRAAIFLCVLLAWGGLVAFQINAASFGFAATGLFGLVIVAPLIGLVVSTIVGLVSRRWRPFALFGIALVLAFSSSWAAGLVSLRQRMASIAAAGPIIAAVERYHSETGAYPRSFGDLIPAYLPDEPLTRMGFQGTLFRLSSSHAGFSISRQRVVNATLTTRWRG